MRPYNYLFGPVPSRRFGRSLGIDLVPMKTCCYDCVFCQLGRTPDKTLEQKEWVPVDGVLDEIHAWIKTDGVADYMTLSGSGEPTLHSRFGDVLDGLKSIDIPSVLLSNGGLFFDPGVRRAAALADIVKVSFSAWDQDSFGWINRPHDKLNFKEILDGLIQFSNMFKGQLLVEVFLLTGMNSKPGDVEKIADLVKKLNPDQVHLNTVVRPPAESFAKSVPQDSMAWASTVFDPPATIIADVKSEKSGSVPKNEADILSMLRRRPCTMDQISKVFNLHVNEVAKYLALLMKTNDVLTTRKSDAVYYVVKK
ncbi:MAG: radical SAM protein [Desulfobacteraceae bacterium]|nr:radical SAM protein [Desulfobacteraceae bacterium]